MKKIFVKSITYQFSFVLSEILAIQHPKILREAASSTNHNEDDEEDRINDGDAYSTSNSTGKKKMNYRLLFHFKRICKADDLK